MKDIHTLVTRRGVLRAGVVGSVGLTAAALFGCRSANPGADGARPGGSAGTTAAVVAPKTLYPHTIPLTTKQPKRGGSLVIAIANDLATLDNAKSGAIGNLGITNTVYDALLRRKMTSKDTELPGTSDPQKDLEGALAQSWEISPDGMTYVFKIRPGVKWQNVAPVNGRPFVAEDVALSIKRYSTVGIWGPLYEAVAKVETPDAATVRVTLTKPSPDFIVPLAEQNQNIMPREISDNNSIDKVAIGTGPFILTEAVPGKGSKYVRNPDYWGKEGPYLDNYEYRLIPDLAAQLAAFRAGQTGQATAANAREADAIKASVADVQIQQTYFVKASFMTAFNLKLPKWQDERVRRALSLLLDRDEINETLYAGQSATIPVFPWPFVMDHRPTGSELGKWWRYDVAEAKKMLQAAGQENLKFDWPYYNPYQTSQNEVIIDQWKRAGIGVNPQSKDYVSFNSQLVGVSYPDTMQVWDPHGSQADNHFRDHLKTGLPTNVFNIVDPQLDTWADQQSVELNPQKRREIHKKIWDHVLDKAYRIEHANNVTYTVRQPWLRGMLAGVGGEGFKGPFSYMNSQFIPHVWIDK